MQATVLTWALMAWLATIAAIVFYRLLTDKISTAGMTKRAAGGGTDPERLVMLFTTISGALGYGAYALSTGPIVLGGTEEAGVRLIMPDVPNALLAAVGGGQVLYLTGKLSRGILDGGDK